MPSPAAARATAMAGAPAVQPRRQVVPTARRLAQQEGIDLELVEGTGPRGRILLEDVQRAAQAPARPPSEVFPVGSIRKTIATRMMESLRNMAQVTITTEADVTEAMELQDRLNRGTVQNLNPLHLLIRATARALKEHPHMNALQKQGGLEVAEEVNVGVAVSLEEGLIVPAIRRADEKGLAQIAAEARDLARRARERKATYEEVTRGTFTVTNLGAYDVDAFTPIINPPQVGILGVGRVREKPVVHRGEIAIRSTVSLSLTFDHRVVDGTPAAQFLQAIKGYVEAPGWMVS